MRIFSLIFILLSWGAAANQTLNGTVISVIDGDSVMFQTKNQRTFGLRLFGIDAPEKNQEYSAEATQVLEKMLLNQNVEAVCRDEQDRHGRQICTVMLNRQDVGAELLAQGCAWVYPEDYGSSGRYYELQRYAKDYRKGLWAQPQPVAPWLWRHGKPQPNTPVQMSGTRGVAPKSCPAGQHWEGPQLQKGKVVPGHCAEDSKS